MPDPSSLELHSVVPAGDFTFAIAKVAGSWLPRAQALLQDTEFVSLATGMTVPDFLSFGEGTNATVSGVETQYFATQARLFSQDWTALASYNWLIAGQDTTVAFIGTMRATIWCATYMSELMSWFWL